MYIGQILIKFCQTTGKIRRSDEKREGNVEEMEGRKKARKKGKMLNDESIGL